MRLRVVAFAVALAACKTDPPPSPPSPTSTPAAAPAPTPTSATAKLPPLTCANIQSCVGQCPLGAALTACADACVARLTPAARPFYDALQACVAPHCADADAAGPCRDPASLGCKLCAMSHCGSLASACLLH